MEELEKDSMLGAFLGEVRPKQRPGRPESAWWMKGRGKSILGRSHRKYKEPERENSWCDYSSGENQRSCSIVREPESGPKKLERVVQEAKHTVLCRSWKAACVLTYAYSRFKSISDWKVNSKKILSLNNSALSEWMSAKIFDRKKQIQLRYSQNHCRMTKLFSLDWIWICLYFVQYEQLPRNVLCNKEFLCLQGLSICCAVNGPI